MLVLVERGLLLSRRESRGFGALLQADFEFFLHETSSYCRKMSCLSIKSFLEAFGGRQKKLQA